MRCPKCERDNLRSFVDIGMVSTTCMATHQYYDADGRYHYHDRNERTESFKCRNGHSFVRVTRLGCVPCGLPDEESFRVTSL